MDFRWIDWNRSKVAGHGVTPEEVEWVVERASEPYPQYREDDKLLVWGPTASGRLLQVVFVLDEDDSAFVVHARPLTAIEKRRWRRHLRRRGKR
jgi:uncharacterized DUF497 family protein